MNFDGLTFLTALVLYSQSDYLNHSNRDSDDTVVRIGINKTKFVLKIESNAWRI